LNIKLDQMHEEYIKIKLKLNEMQKETEEKDRLLAVQIKYNTDIEAQRDNLWHKMTKDNLHAQNGVTLLRRELTRMQKKLHEKGITYKIDSGLQEIINNNET